MVGSSWFGSLPPVLHLLDESADVVLHRAVFPEPHLLGRDQAALLRQEGEAGQDQPLRQLPDVAG